MTDQTMIDRGMLLETAVEAARQAGRLILDRIDTDLGIKLKDEGNYNLVTVMDVASENLIKEIISSRYPASHFLAEESGGYEELEELTWVIDPIDGTVNYAHGIPVYCISIAAVIANHPVVGVIYDPGRDDLFTAIKGEGAYHNGTRMEVSHTDDLTRSVLTTGFPYNVAENPYNCIDTFVAFLRLGIPVRRLGSAALDLAYVAAGRFDGYWETTLNPWDVAAGALMVVEAGGSIDTYSPEGTDTIIVTNRLLATNGRIAEAMKGVLQSTQMA